MTAVLPLHSEQAACAGYLSAARLLDELTEASSARSLAARRRAGVLLDRFRRVYCGECPIATACRSWAEQTAGRAGFDGVAAGTAYRNGHPLTLPRPDSPVRPV